MGKVIIIGAGGVASVAAHKVAQNSDMIQNRKMRLGHILTLPLSS